MRDVISFLLGHAPFLLSLGLMFPDFNGNTLQANNSAELNRKSVNETMKNSFRALLELQPYLTNSSYFSDPKNKVEIQKRLQILASLNHAFPKAMKSEEPGLAALVKLFDNTRAAAELSFQQGAFEYSRNRLRGITGICFACHSRLGIEKSFEDPAHGVEGLKLTPREKGEIYAATRQFDRALNQYDEALKKVQTGEMGFFEMDQIFRQAVRISVGAKNDPNLTLEWIEKLLGQKQLPEIMKQTLLVWKKEAKVWQQEKWDLSTATPKQIFAKAQNWVNKAAKQKNNIVDESRDLALLRANAALHRVLERDPQFPQRGEVLELLGVCSNALRDSQLWELDLMYWEACVREFPATAVAKRCFKKFSERIYLGFTGSSGTQIPADELKRLSELRDLAK